MAIEDATVVPWDRQVEVALRAREHSLPNEYHTVGEVEGVETTVCTRREAVEEYDAVACSSCFWGIVAPEEVPNDG